MAHAQTDGSWHQVWKLSRTAVILKTAAEEPETWRSVQTYADGEHTSSTESEWASVVDGILLAIKKDVGALELENDNLGVITSLTGHQRLKKPVRFYYDYIYELTAPLEWFAVRWIPREMNRADGLFRIAHAAAADPLQGDLR